MNFDSLNYILLFLPLVLLLYYLSANNLLRNSILVIASYSFYAWGNYYLTLLLFSSSFVDFFIGKSIGINNSKSLSIVDEDELQKVNKKRKRLLLASIFFNIGLLAFFKYWDWLMDLFYITKNGHPIFDLSYLKHGIDVPPGISFYTFQTLSYTIDIYRKESSPKNNFVGYLTFVAFFPQLIAGPIERSRDLLPQLIRLRRKISGRVAESAFFLISWGLFKKIVFADNLGHLTEICQENISSPGIGLILIISFSFQIYFDFSAYSDIARGSARLFGIRLRRNFLTPYFAINPSDFWKRWHISLSQWVRDYVYIPLGGNKCSKPRNIVNLFITMFLIGLWHGAGKFFILWGIYHASLLVIYRIFPIDQKLIKCLGNLYGGILSILIMFLFTMFGWLLFFSKSGKNFTNIFQSLKKISYIFTDPSKITPLFYDMCYGLLLFTIPMIVAEIVAFRNKREFVDMYKFLGVKIKIILYIFMFYGLLFFGSRGSYNFIYFQF